MNDAYESDQVAEEVVKTFRSMGIRIFKGRLYIANSGAVEKDKGGMFFVFNHYRIDLHGHAKEEEPTGIINIIIEFDSLEEAANFMRDLEDVVVYDLLIYEDENTIEYQHQFYLVNSGLFVVVYEPKPRDVSIESEEGQVSYEEDVQSSIRVN